MFRFGQSVVGSSFILNGITFKVLEIIPYPKKNVSPQYREILDFNPGLLVAVAYRGTLIPNITLSDGVVRLTKIEIAGKIINKPGAISKALRITEAMTSYEIKKV